MIYRELRGSFSCDQIIPSIDAPQRCQENLSSQYLGFFMFSLQQFYILDQSAIDELRKAKVCWWRMEEGAPAVHPQTMMEDIGQEDYGNLLYAFVQASALEPGVRTFANPLIDLGPYSRHSHGVPDLYFDGEKLKPEIEINVTEAHLTLLKAMSLEHDHPKHLPRFEAKRVYSDYRCAATGAYLVLNAIPDDEDEEVVRKLTSEELQPYKQLHLETAAALQALLLEATVVPGFYEGRLFGGFRKVRDLDDFEFYKSLMKDLGRPATRQGYINEIVRLASRKGS